MTGGAAAAEAEEHGSEDFLRDCRPDFVDDALVAVSPSPAPDVAGTGFDSTDLFRPFIIV